MQIKPLSESFNQLIDPESKIILIGDSFRFTEGPVWNAEKQFLLFSDIPENRIYSWKESSGVDVYREGSHFSNGLTYDNEGFLIACEHERRAVSREVNGQAEPVAMTYQNQKLNSPNDVIVSKDGSIIFTDPTYGLRVGMGGPAEQELPFQGVFRIPPDSTELELLTDSLERPNGLALSIDEKQLYVTDTVRQHIRIFNIQNGWQISGGEVWAELWDDELGGRPDGIKLDRLGNVFCTGPGGVWIFNPEAVLIGRIYFPENTSNLAWGEDGHSLFITSSNKVYKISCETSGVIPGK
jgi:gluconolactonase